MRPEKEYETITSAGARLGLSDSFLKRLINEGKLPYLRVGRSRMLHLETVRATLVELAKESVSDATCGKV